MDFNPHFDLEGKHAFLGASKYSWINYDKEKLTGAYTRFLATQQGTILHDFAADCIRLSQKLPKSKKTLNQYVNDAIGFKMRPEQALYYSDNCFGTTDAILFREKKLRIHDLKTGVTPGHMQQLEVYTALFCLEYHINPSDIDIELRIYQSEEVLINEPDPEYIRGIMEKIIMFDKHIEILKTGE
jgi:hypothetical protein